MAIQQSAKVSVRNDTDGDADIILFHNNSATGTQRARWTVGSGKTTPPLEVLFRTGSGSELDFDYWSILFVVKNGKDAGCYINTGSLIYPDWKECNLGAADAGQSITFAVGASSFDIALSSLPCKDGMTRLAPPARAPVSHVFVVMLENHSFDNMLAMSGIPGIKAATPADCNIYVDPAGRTYTFCVQAGAPVSLSTDPGHEFPDVVEQLCGQGVTFPQGGPYPPIDNSGFAANYATSTSEAPYVPPPLSEVQDIMDCFKTPSQLQVLYTLATQFGVCDHWFSSIPGPTWPNRFFLHGASSSGFDDSPTNAQMGEWHLPGNGFDYVHGSIFQHLAKASIPHRFYSDFVPSSWLSAYSDDPGAGSRAGAVPQASALTGVSMSDFESLEDFASDLQKPYPYPYTFIEPHYGDITGGTYRGGSSQHPMDDVHGGEALLKAVFKAIHASPYWSSSVLIVLYDEHGGFYDCLPPPEATPPGDKPPFGYNRHGFDFSTLGVRVPALVISPLLRVGSVDSTVYDHSSVPKLLEDLWGLKPLTDRDSKANSPLSLLSLSRPREDRIELPEPMSPLHAAPRRPSSARRAEILAQPVPGSGNLAGALANLRKADAELSATYPELGPPSARGATIRTRGDVEVYAAEVLSKVRLVRARRRAARAGGGV